MILAPQVRNSITHLTLECKHFDWEITNHRSNFEANWLEFLKVYPRSNWTLLTQNSILERFYIFFYPTINKKANHSQHIKNSTCACLLMTLKLIKLSWFSVSTIMGVFLYPQWIIMWPKLLWTRNLFFSNFSWMFL